MTRRQILFLSMLLIIGFVYQFYKRSHSEDSLLTQNSIQRNPTVATDRNTNEELKRKLSQQNSAVTKANSPTELNRRLPKPTASKNQLALIPAADQLQKPKISALDTKWMWWTNTTAVSRAHYQPSTDVAIGEVDQEIVIAKDSQISSPNEFYAETPLVLFDPQRQKMALLTGVYVVTARSPQDLNELTKDNDFEVVNSFPHLQIAFLKPRKNPFNLNEVANGLSKDERVKSMEYEILKGNLVKN